MAQETVFFWLSKSLCWCVLPLRGRPPIFLIATSGEWWSPSWFITVNLFLEMQVLVPIWSLWGWGGGGSRRSSKSRGWAPPLSYLSIPPSSALQRDFWGDEVVLFAMSCMWSVRITVLNSKTLQEYRIWHDRHMEEADMVVVYNGANHFTAAGKGRFTRRCSLFILPVKLKWLDCQSTVRFAMLLRNDALADAQLFYWND